MVLLVSCLFAGCSGSTKDTTAAGSTAADTTTAEEGSTDAAGGSEKSIADIKVGVSFSQLAQERLLYEKELMEAYAKEKGFTLYVQGADGDEATQMSQCENLVANGIDVLVLHPVNGYTASEIAKMAHEADVKVLIYDTLVLDCDLDFYVSFDLVECGRAYAQYCVDQVPSGNYLVLNGDATWYATAAQKQGIYEVLQPYIDDGSINVIADYNCEGFNTDVAMGYTESALTANQNDIDAIVCIYDGMSQGAIAALEDQGMAGTVPITGQDAELAACQRIVEGTQSMTVYKPVSKLAKLAMDAALSLAQGQMPESNGTTNNGYGDIPSYFPDFHIVTKENMYDTVIADGFHTEEEIYANIPEDQWPSRQ